MRTETSFILRQKWALPLVLFLTAVAVLAQVPAATILGVVKDSSGAVVPGVSITLRNVDTDQSRTTTSADDGSYRLPALPRLFERPNLVLALGPHRAGQEIGVIGVLEPVPAHSSYGRCRAHRG